jgi:UTP--glucose-1-phosphate uridylyltransferase
VGACRIRKGVIPAAGLGTRLLPATKAQPKEMVPVVDRPAIQYVVEEAVAAGIRDLVVVTSRGKASIEDHFDRALDLEHRLETSGKLAELEMVRRLATLARLHYVRQGEPKGLGHAVASAADHVGDEAFAVLLPDDLIDPALPVLERMRVLAEEEGATVVALEEVERDEIASYGAAVVEEEVSPGVLRLGGLVEKPSPEEAPSLFGVIGRYVLQPSVLPRLFALRPGRGGELQLTDALAGAASSERVLGVVLERGRFDVGNVVDLVVANVCLALEREELAGQVAAALSTALGLAPGLVVARPGRRADGAAAEALR